VHHPFGLARELVFDGPALTVADGCGCCPAGGRAFSGWCLCGDGSCGSGLCGGSSGVRGHGKSWSSDKKEVAQLIRREAPCASRKLRLSLARHRSLVAIKHARNPLSWWSEAIRATGR